MSIWSKPVGAVTYEDVEQFCEQRQREGVNLDYKGEIPGSLENLVAAFANTVGGMIVFGVNTNENNEPEWPPDGMANFDHFSERITQKCAAAIYPPILPNIGRLLDIPGMPDRKLAVVRVDESPEKPHAVDSGRKIYIRTGDVIEPIDLANVRRIEEMIGTRTRSEARAQFLRDRHMARYKRFVPLDGHSVTAWWHLCPFFPTRQLCPLDECIVPGQRLIHRGPDGAWGLIPHFMRHSDKVLPGEYAGYVGATVYGDVFGAKRFMPSAQDSPALRQREQIVLTRQFLANAQSFLSRPVVQHPGLLRMAMGYWNVSKKRMVNEHDFVSNCEFPDDEFETETSTTFEEFTQSDFCGPQARPRVLVELLSDVAHAFDLPMPAHLPVS